jgi:hypothetical protein
MARPKLRAAKVDPAKARSSARRRSQPGDTDAAIAENSPTRDGLSIDRSDNESSGGYVSEDLSAESTGASDSGLVSEEIEDLLETQGRKTRGGKKAGKTSKRKNTSSARVQEASSVGTDDFGADDMETDGEVENDELLTVGKISVPSLILGDLISSYVVLRAFSWQLKLSPFTLEAFLEAVVSDRPNRLIDEVHVCLMRSLVADELKIERVARSLDLEHLDFITWPSFVWEWLASQGYTVKVVNANAEDDADQVADENDMDEKDEKDEMDEMDVDQAEDAERDVLKQVFNLPKKTKAAKKAVQPEYHALSLDIKASVLQTLCDHLVERPIVRAEIDRRESNGEAITGIRGKGSYFAMMTPSEMEEAIEKAKEDGNNDISTERCVLCGLGGILMCCDSCPAAYHLRCAGEEASGYKTKGANWRCPECLAGGRGEAAGLRLAVAGRTPSGERVYNFNGAVICSHAAHVDGRGVSASERLESLPVRIFYGDDGQAIVKKMKYPKKQRLDPSSLEAVGNFPGWPEEELPSGIDVFENKYSWGWIAAAAALRSHVEDTKKRRSNDKLWIPHGTCDRAMVNELPAPLSISLYEWQPLNSQGRQITMRCGKCFSCLRPNLKRACMNPTKKAAVPDGESHSKLGYVCALLIKMEREFWSLAENQWSGADGGHMFRNQWISGVRDATNAGQVADLMMQFEAALRPACFRAHWYKYYPSSLLPAGVGGDDLVEDVPGIDGGDSSRSRDVYDLSSDMSIAKFSKSRSEWETKHFEKSVPPSAKKKLGPPKFLIRQAILNAGRKPIPGVKYRQGVWRMNNERLKWISEVENCKTISDVALAIRKLERALRWDSATKPKFSTQLMLNDIYIRGKRVDEEGNVEYALVKAKSQRKNATLDEGTGNDDEENLDEDEDNLPDSAVWALETRIPLWLIKSYEETNRRQAARVAMQAAHAPQSGPSSSNDVKKEEPESGHLCGLCYNSNDSHSNCLFIKCKVCARHFHGHCVIMTDEEVKETEPDDWTCPGCIANEKLINRLAKTPKAGQNLPGVDPKDEKPRSTNKKHPGRPPKPFFERSDYSIAERKEILRRLRASDHPELFDIEDEDREAINLDPPSIMPFDGMVADQENPTSCPVCQYPDLGRPLIQCTGCSREFHRECFGIVSNESRLWDLKTIKCAECSGKRVRPPTESVVMAAIEAAQLPASNASSIQERVKQRSQRARQAKEAQAAEDANKAKWMEAADRVMTRVYRMQVAEPFRFPIPVDVLTDYTNYVESPMDLETIRDELYSFESPLDVVNRMKMIVDNCLAYNGDDSKVTGQAQHMLKSFMRIWKKEGLPLSGEEISDELMAKVGESKVQTADDAPYLRVVHLLDGEPAADWQRRVGKVLGQLSRLDCVEPFLRPVPKGFLNYHEVIRRPMDLGTIKSKMADGRYLDPSQVLLDMDLIWTNCASFNASDAPIIEDMHQSKEEFEKLWVAGKVMTPSADGVSTKRDDAHSSGDWVESARSVLYRLINFVPQASWFYEPVDETEFPGYNNIVTNPVCLKQISEQLNNGQYSSPGALWADVELITKNSEAFNGPEDEVTEGARVVNVAFRKYWKNFGLPNPSEVGSLESLFEMEWISSAIACVDAILANPLADPFAAPVSERTAPGYTKVVKRPMDFSTIKFNLEKGSYSTALQVAEDVSLIFQNCRAYNPAGDEIRALGCQVEAIIRKMWANAELPVPKRWRKR